MAKLDDWEALWGREGWMLSGDRLWFDWPQGRGVEKMEGLPIRGIGEEVVEAARLVNVAARDLPGADLAVENARHTLYIIAGLIATNNYRALCYLAENADLMEEAHLRGVVVPRGRLVKGEG